MVFDGTSFLTATWFSSARYFALPCGIRAKTTALLRLPIFPRTVLKSTYVSNGTYVLKTTYVTQWRGAWLGGPQYVMPPPPLASLFNKIMMFYWRPLVLRRPIILAPQGGGGGGLGPQAPPGHHATDVTNGTSVLKASKGTYIFILLCPLN